MVASDFLHSPQSYLELVTGYCFCIREGSVAEIESILRQQGKRLRNFALGDLERIITNKRNVVLVQCFSGVEPYVSELRWFEVPARVRC